MSISFPPGLGFTVKRTPRVPAEPINNRRASKAFQSLPSDYFEPNSQSSVKKLINIGEDFWEQMENQGETPDSSEHSIELNLDTKEHFLDNLENPGEVLSPVGVDAFVRTRQPASQAPITPPPFPHRAEAFQTHPPFPHRTEALPPRSPLPTPPKQQERTSLQRLYQGVPASAETDEDCKSPDEQVRIKARRKLGMRKSRIKREKEQGINASQHERNKLKTQAAKLKMTVTEYKKQIEDRIAKRKGFNSDTELKREQKRALAERMGLTVPQLKKKYRERAALKKAQKAQLESQNR